MEFPFRDEVMSLPCSKVNSRERGDEAITAIFLMLPD